MMTMIPRTLGTAAAPCGDRRNHCPPSSVRSLLELGRCRSGENKACAAEVYGKALTQSNAPARHRADDCNITRDTCLTVPRSMCARLAVVPTCRGSGQVLLPSAFGTLQRGAPLSHQPSPKPTPLTRQSPFASWPPLDAIYNGGEQHAACTQVCMCACAGRVTSASAENTRSTLHLAFCTSAGEVALLPGW